MSGGVFRQGNALRRMRAGMAGVARLLLLAFALQLVIPVLQIGGVAALAGEAALQADLQSSLCHDGSSDGSDDPAQPPSRAKHCIFCLPMAGDPVHAGTEAGPAGPVAAPLGVAPATHDQVREPHRPGLARSRAPPSVPRTV